MGRTRARPKCSRRTRPGRACNAACGPRGCGEKPALAAPFEQLEQRLLLVRPIEVDRLTRGLEVEPGIPDYEDCSAVVVSSAGGGGGGASGVHAATGFASQPVGNLTPRVTDGVSAGPAHAWTSNAVRNGDQSYGNGRISTTMPSIRVIQSDAQGPEALQFDFSGTDVRVFLRKEGSTTSFEPLAANSDSLTWAGGRFVYRTAAGEAIEFNDFSANAPEEHGRFVSRSDAFGNRATVTQRDIFGQPTRVETLSPSSVAPASGTSPRQSWTYTYDTIGGSDRVTTATLARGDGAVIRVLTYGYYAGGSPNGTDGDLESIEVRDGAGALIDSTYYRYYTFGQPDSDKGFFGALKFAFDAASQKRLAAAVPGFRTASDAAIAPYASDYYEYDAEQRVVRHDRQGVGCSACTGGIGTYTFSYATNPAAATDDFNAWRTRTTVTRPDGTQVVNYTNLFGQSMLDVTRATDGGTQRQWGSFTRYDTAGRPMWRASPEALDLPANLADAEAHVDLMGSQGGNYLYVRDAAGLIEVRSYGVTATATETVPGDVVGLVSSTAVQRGEMGSAIPQTATTYVRRSAGGRTASFVAVATAFAPAAQTTTYSYSFRTDTTQVASVAVTLPVVSAAQNGPGTADVQTRVFDPDGREIWSRDADGFLHFTAYDPASGAVVKRIVDVDAARTGDFSALPAGWATPAGGGLHLVTVTAVDSLGRGVMVTDPRGNVTYRVFDDVAHAVRTYVGWDAAARVPTGPIHVSRRDVSGTYSETLSFAAVPAVDAAGRPTGAEPITNVQSLSRSLLNAAGQAVATDRYTNLDGLTYSTAVTLGTAGTNYLRTTTAYGKQGKVERVETPSGTITHHVYDGLARPTSTWIGTDDSTTDGFKWSPTNGAPSSNMTRVAAHEYDAGGVGNGNRTRSTRFPGGGEAPRVVTTAYDWRNRPVVTKAGATDDPATEAGDLDRPLSYVTYDDLGRVTSRQIYDGDGVVVADADADGTPDKPAAGLLRASESSSYDVRNRAFRTETAFVDQGTGAIGPRQLSTDSFFDRRGNLVLEAAPGQPMMQYVTDGAGRTVRVLTLGNEKALGWADAVSTAASLVLEQRDTAYDAAGNVILETTRQRFHDAAPTAFGVLGSPSAGIGARVSFATRYYDAANRPTATGDVGTNGGVTYVRPATVPGRSDTALVTSFTYDAAGRLQDTTDPRGIVNRTLYDALGRTTSSIANFTGGVPGTTSDVTTLFGYDAAGRLASRTAVQPAGRPAQVTGYVYGVSPAAGSTLPSNEILAETRYPDPVTGLPVATERDIYTVNALGERTTLTDRAGTVHTYVRDVVGRQTADVVTTLGKDVDGSVRRIESAYDVLGRPVRVTSLTEGGEIVNQVVSAYNGFGQLTTQWQARGTKVDTDETPAVRTAYSEGVGGNHSRPIQLTYPDGYAVSFNYSGIDAAVSRPTNLSGPRSGQWSVGPMPADLLGPQPAGSSRRAPSVPKGIIEAFRYLGAGTVIERSRPEVNATLTMDSATGAPGDAGDRYTGLDRFGRVVDQRWVAGTTAAAPALDRTTATFDRGGDRLSRGVPQAPAFDETYTYDALGQLDSFRRGPAAAPATTQQWQFDALGNWSTFTTDATVQPRTHNAQNELTQVGTQKLSYSATGNLTADAEGRSLAFDAWNRLVRVSDASGRVVARYEYDGLNRRVVEQVGPVAATAPIRDIFYSAQWQVLEERVRTATGDIGRTAEARYVWSPVYVDALVMRDRDADRSAATGTGGLEERVYAIQDANWNTTALVAASGVRGVLGGAVISRFVYTPYGESQALTASWTPAAPAAVAAISWQHLFQGLEFTEITGLAYVRNRDYSASLGRFIERDPIGFKAGDNNWYRFVGNNSIIYVDPSGLTSTIGMCNADNFKCIQKCVAADGGRNSRQYLACVDDCTMEWIACRRKTDKPISPPASAAACIPEWLSCMLEGQKDMFPDTVIPGVDDCVDLFLGRWGLQVPELFHALSDHFTGFVACCDKADFTSDNKVCYEFALYFANPFQELKDAALKRRLEEIKRCIWGPLLLRSDSIALQNFRL